MLYVSAHEKHRDEALHMILIALGFINVEQSLPLYLVELVRHTQTYTHIQTNTHEEVRQIVLCISLFCGCTKCNCTLLLFYHIKRVKYGSRYAIVWKCNYILGKFIHTVFKYLGICSMDDAHICGVYNMVLLKTIGFVQTMTCL